MSGVHHADTEGAELLAHDWTVERRLIWKGLLSLFVVVVLAVVRQRWWL